nr:FAD-dependent oxidoreductase [Actinomycetota bacterium]
EVHAGTVILAAGVTYSRLGVPTLEELSGRGVFYGASVSQAQEFTARQVYVIGGGNSAGQAAVHLGRYASRVTLLVRSATLAQSMSQYLRDEIDAAPNIEIRYSTEVVDGGGDRHLEYLTLREGPSGTTSTVPADGLFVLIGAQPRTDWLPPEIMRDEHGFVLTGADVAGEWPLERPPFMFETSAPGIFGVGDVRARSVKRVASAVGEGSVVIQQVHQHLLSQAEATSPSTR